MDKEREGINDAIEAVWNTYTSFTEASNPYQEASALIKLNDAVSDLASWHSLWDGDRGEIRGSL